MPVLGASVSEMCYNYGASNGVKTGETTCSCAVSYFNGKAGCWEPAVEKFQVLLKNSMQADGKKTFTVRMDREININLTEGLLKTLKDAYDSFVTAN